MNVVVSGQCSSAGSYFAQHCSVASKDVLYIIGVLMEIGNLLFKMVIRVLNLQYV